MSLLLAVYFVFSSTVQSSPIAISARPFGSSDPGAESSHSFYRRSDLWKPTGAAEPAYVPGPTRRGTVGLIISSLFTLTLCVYTAIHPNICRAEPVRVGKLELSRHFVYKFYWVMIALFAPEFLFYAAYSQWKDARWIFKEAMKFAGREHEDVLSKIGGAFKPFGKLLKLDVEKADEKKEDLEEAEAIKKYLVYGDGESEPSSVAGRWEWANFTMTSAFFVVMGGLAYREPTSKIIDNPEDDWAALTPRGFVFFMKLGIIPPTILDVKDIKDRSKADSLAKFIVCTQALWMVANAIARKASGLPLTLLEINVLTHVILAVLVFVLWWNKPLTLMRPIFLPVPDFKNSIMDLNGHQEGGNLSESSNSVSSDSTTIDTPRKRPTINLEEAQLEEDNYKARVARIILLCYQYGCHIGLRHTYIGPKDSGDKCRYDILMREQRKAESIVEKANEEKRDLNRLDTEQFKHLDNPYTIEDEGVRVEHVVLKIPPQFSEQIYSTGNIAFHDGAQLPLRGNLIQKFKYRSSRKFDWPKLNVYATNKKKREKQRQRQRQRQRQEQVSETTTTAFEKAQEANLCGFFHFSEKVHMDLPAVEYFAKFTLAENTFWNEEQLEELRGFFNEAVLLDNAIVWKASHTDTSSQQRYQIKLLDLLSFLDADKGRISFYVHSDPPLLAFPETVTLWHNLVSPSKKIEKFKVTMSAIRAFLLAMALFLVYSAPHFSAWNTHFPSKLERYLWRFSSVIIAATLPAILVLLVYVKVGTKMHNIYHDLEADYFPEISRNKALGIISKSDLIRSALEFQVFNYVFIALYWLYRVILAFLLGFHILVLMTFYLILHLFLPFVVVLPFIAARIFIVVEAFLSIRSLPVGAFDEVEWSSFWPHFG